MKFDIDINENRISATSTSYLEDSEVRIHVSLPWALFGMAAPAPKTTPPTVQIPLNIAENSSEEIEHG